MRGTAGWRHWAPVVLWVAGATLLLAAVPVGWYSYTNTQTGSSDLPANHGSQQFGESSSTFYLGREIGLKYSENVCLGSSPCDAHNLSTTTESTTYSEMNFNETGALYGALEWVALSGVVLGVASALCLALSKRRPRLRSGALLIGTFALALAIAGPVAVAVAQPADLASDIHGVNSTTPYPWNSANSEAYHNQPPLAGPWSSFAGSTSAPCVVPSGSTCSA